MWGYCTLSLKLDTGNFKDAYIDGKMVREIWFRDNLIYIKKRAPTISLTVTKDTENEKIVMACKYVDQKNMYRYYDETLGDIPGTSPVKQGTHGLVFMQTDKLGARVLTLNSPGRTTSYSTKKFTATSYYSVKFKPVHPTVKYTMRAWMCYENELTGKKVFVYSSPVVCSYDSLE